MFITFVQNNSGGYFIQNEEVDAYVIIEGNTLEEILYKANNIFRNYREYCDCCGERWDDDWKDENNLDEEPMIYGKPIHEFRSSFFRDKAIIHRLDGSKEVVDLIK